MYTGDEFGAAPVWQDELIALARNITQGDDPPRSPEEEAEELAGHQRLCEIVGSLNGRGRGAGCHPKSVVGGSSRRAP